MSEKSPGDRPSTISSPVPASVPVPSLGRIVHYTMSDQDVTVANHRRRLLGARGNDAISERTYPLIITAVYADDAVVLLSGQVLLDGDSTYWIASVREGTGPGAWCWPPRTKG